MKKVLFLVCFVIIICSLGAREMIHAYFGDYTEIVRIVFVLRTQVHYHTLLDTDNRALHIHLNGTRLSQNILPMNFEHSQIVSSVRYEQSGNDLKINIMTHVVYYAETFFLHERNNNNENVFKIVVDIFRQREPTTLDAARHYLYFFETVGYHDRAAALRRRINANEFAIEPIRTIATQPIITPPVMNVVPLPIDESMFLENPLQYLRPDDIQLNDVQRNWVNEAFRIYELFRNIHNAIEQVERTLRLYDNQRSVNISFIDTMSRSYNSLSDINIQINEIRLQFNNILQRQNFTTNNTITYTQTMISHVLRVLDSYQQRVNQLQSAYDARINR
jgi:hypothetical protein